MEKCVYDNHYSEIQEGPEVFLSYEDVSLALGVGIDDVTGWIALGLPANHQKLCDGVMFNGYQKYRKF